MRSTLLVTALLLSGAFLALAPAANAYHCAQYPLATEASCEVRHLQDQYVDPWVDFVLCFYTTAPNQWLRYCLVINIDEIIVPLGP
jgi:hypothetical protein